MITLCNTPIEEKFIRETLTFIADDPTLEGEDSCEYSKCFAKSLGYKSDSVGWVSNITPTPNALSRIFDKAHICGAAISAYYELSFTDDYQCEWYLMSGNPKGGYLAASEWDKYEDYPIGKVKAYSIPDNIRFTRIGCTDFLLLREDVVKEIKNANFTGMEYVWCPDKGRYRSPQYFQSFPQYVLPHWYQCTHKKLTEDIASNLTDNAKILSREAKEVWIALPMAVDTEFLSQYDFVATYPSDSHDNRILARKCVRDYLIDKKLAKPNDFEPIITLSGLTRENAFPLVKREAYKYTPIPENISAQIAKEYEKSLKKEKPVRMATEKSALSKLRRAKRKESELFGKKATERILGCSIDARLMPYYNIANGGALSSEYSYFSIEEALKSNEEFWELQSAEDNDIIPKDAKVFGVCADGENIILLPDGAVVRYQQGEVQISLRWNDLPSFFTEAIEE